MNPFNTDSLMENLKPALNGKRILLGISGSIAAFKACDLIRGLRECGAEVRVVLTDSAQRFVTPLTLETLSGQPVFTSLWNEGGNTAPGEGTHHIDAARWADLALIAPATANTLAKLAHGFADDLLSTELLAFRGPTVIAPAMNPAMYEHPAVQANVATLRTRGVCFAGPVHGVTSCGEEGLGRMLEPAQILEEVARCFYAPTRGKTVLITLGPTRSAIDPVRYLTNRSSGLMGAALAWAARRAGYDVRIVAGHTHAVLPSDAQVVRVQTAREMLEKAQSFFSTADIFISAAAVLDWDVRGPAKEKLKKADGAPSLSFVVNPDILATLCAQKQPHQFVVGFAAETHDVLKSGVRKRETKGCDALFANDVSGDQQGFESSQNSGWWITKNQEIQLLLQSKTQLAEKLISLVNQR